MNWPENLREESKDQLYFFIDKYYKNLPKVDDKITGTGNEWTPGLGSSSSYSSNSKNMDLWNNAVGRRYGKKTQGRLKLFKLLIKGHETPVSKKDGRLPNNLG